MKTPFTEQEEKIMILLVEAHKLMTELEPTHPSDILEWTDGVHKCQNVLTNRLVRRDYPWYFKTVSSDFGDAYQWKDR